MFDVVDRYHLRDLMQWGARLDGQDRSAHDLLDGSRGQRRKRFGLWLRIRQQRQPPVAPGDPIGVTATDQVPFANHSSQTQVRGEHGHGAYALLEHEHRATAHAGPNRRRNDIPRHDVVSG